MRKIYNTLLMTLLLLVVGSCGQKQDTIFRGSSAVRVQEQIDALSSALAAHPNGWSVSYFYGAAAAAHGGTTLLWKFDTEHSTVEASSIYTGVDQVDTSTYTIKENGGALLTFDTHNEAIHYFSDPIAPGERVGDNLGLEGDFEFIVQSISDTEIVLISSKYRTPIIMTPLADGADWAGLLETAKAAAYQILAPSYDFYLNGELIESASISDNVIDMEIPLAGSENTFSVQAPFIPTETGFNTMKPISFTETDDAPIAQHFTYNVEDLTFVCSDAGVDFYIQKVFPPINETLVSMDATYFFDFAAGNPTTYNGMGPAVQSIFENAQANNYGGAELLKLVTIGKNPFAGQPGDQVFLFQSFDGASTWSSLFGYTITPVEGTIDQVNFGNIDASLLNAAYYTQFQTYIIDPIVAAGPYKVVTDDPLIHSQYTFTSVSDADFWFTVSK